MNNMIFQNAKLGISVLVFAGVVACGPSSGANPNQSGSTNFSIDHAMKMKEVNDIALSPDGQWVAYVVTRKDEDKDKQFSQIFMTSADGETTLPMTAPYANAGAPQWRPDGRYLGFTGKRGDDEDAESQVWLLDTRGGEAQQYTNVKQGIDSFVWAPDSSKMALVIKDPKPEKAGKNDDQSKSGADEDRPDPFVIDRLQFKKDYVGYLDRRRTHIYLFDGGSDPVQITSGDYDDNDPTWSPDSASLAFVSKREGDPDANDNSDIWRVSGDIKAKSFPLTQITTNPGPDYRPAWSPDGQTIAHVTSIQPEKLWYATEHLAVSPAKGGPANVLTQNYDRMISSPEFSSDGGRIIAIAADGGNRPLISVDPQSGAHEILTPGEQSIQEFDIGPNGEMAVLQSSHTSPYNVHMRTGEQSRQITFVNQDILGGVKFGDVERLSVPGWNDEPVESFVYYPPGYNAGKAYPTIFVLHGGPVSQHDTSFEVWAQMYAAQGYIAVLPNPHGSSGYGQAFSYALDKQWGVPDFADVDAIADYLVDNGISDPDRLGVGGWSYGGILTNYVITKSTRFAGAVTGASEVNHRANYGHDIYQLAWETELGLPWENIEAWESINPFNDLGNVTTPTLVIGGQLDWNVPIQNSEQLYQVLKRRGIETQLVVYPDEYHGIKRPSFVRDRFDRYLAWYEKYVK